jgi:hypothetical protein
MDQSAAPVFGAVSAPISAPEPGADSSALATICSHRLDAFL